MKSLLRCYYFDTFAIRDDSIFFSVRFFKLGVGDGASWSEAVASKLSIANLPLDNCFIV